MDFKQVKTIFMDVLQNYKNFEGRSRRKEFWVFQFCTFLITLPFSIVGGIIGLSLLGLIVSLIFLVPNVAVCIRRLHDTGRSGWFLLLTFIPVVGALVLLYFFLQDSHSETNDFGVSPKVAMT
ncbi:DUF805 domain-containing protein [Marinomonas gallaica]|uniref:DUF805 domain-containing protein n=1 Tax=Marinomonas gallaica TaxID=1806667 RepID=UPI000834F7E2|nr:DUF805 domain-containing protein [Marinomonas gallaica]